MAEDAHHADHLEAALCVEQSKETILADWRELVAGQIDGAEGVDEPVLTDDVPAILDLIADALREGAATALTNFQPVRAHGQQRAALTYTDIHWVLEELYLLRAVVIRGIEDNVGELCRKHLLLIYEVFDQLITVSAEAYINWQLRKEEEARKKAEESVRKLSKLTEMLEAEREERTLFVGAVVYDLRTPLASMQIATDLLENFHERPGVREGALDKLQRNVQRLDAMAQRLLDVNRINAGSRLPLDIEPVDLVDVSQSYVNDAKSSHGPDAVRLEVFDDEMHGWWNREAILRILSNLVENGIKYGEQPVTVRIRPCSSGAGEDGGVEENEPDEVCLEIHNDGPPIPQEDQERIFERFVRLKSAHERHKTGWGIGLTLVRGLTHAMGGRLELESSEGKGTTFTVIMPRDARVFQEV
jgi:signal transduction histidine kinase